MATQVAHPLVQDRVVNVAQSDLVLEQCTLDKEASDSHESLLEASGWTMKLRDFVQLSFGPGLNSFRSMVSSSRRINMQPDVDNVDQSRFHTPEQDPPCSPCVVRRALRFGDPSFISPPSSYSLSVSSPTSPTSPASTQSCSPRATSAPPARMPEQAEEDEDEDDESDMRFVQAVTDRRHRIKLRYSVACARSVDTLPSLEVIRPQKSSLWLRRRRTVSSGSAHSDNEDVPEKQMALDRPRACECLFEMISKQKQDVEKASTPLQTAVLASYLEIYQEKMYDLLVNTRTDLQVRLHPALGPHVPGLIQSPVSTSKEVRELLDFGAKNRAVGATSMNANSSRSHAVFTLDIRLSYSGPQARDLQSRIHFVDLAGSEKQKKTHASGERLQEGIAINQSLSALSRVIQALAGTAGSGVLPVFRESKLTLLLKARVIRVIRGDGVMLKFQGRSAFARQDALSGNSRTVLLACVSPARANFEESISTLEFAARCKLIKTNAKKNEQDKRELIETLSKEKQEVQDRLEAERQQKLLLQQELEREVEESKRNQDLAQKMQEEKQRIEEQLRSLQIAEQQLQLVRKEQDDKEKAESSEWDRLQRLNEEKEAQLQERLQQIDASHAESAEMERQLRELRELQESGAELEANESRPTRQISTCATRRENAARAEELRNMQAEELSQAERERQEVVSELQEDERRRIEDARTAEVELRQRIEEEMPKPQRCSEDLKRELQGLQSLSDSRWALKNADIEKTAQATSGEHKMFRERLLKEPAPEFPLVFWLGISGMEHDMEAHRETVVLVRSDAHKVPRLVNMNPDPSLEVCLTGLDVADQVVPSPDGLVRVNGVQVVLRQFLEPQIDGLLQGRAHIFRVVIPANSSAEYAMLSTAEEEDFETAMKELQANSQVDPRWRRGVDDAVMIVKRDYGTREANQLLDAAKKASEAWGPRDVYRTSAW
ncbi:Kif14 [Symbiodinium natans]|uniref:Kinesin-like protein n=1 Tax=Symbiodinium natans TaxID=878477 RepID=A0A812KCI1_9DINO|nr:Kif14 [Symbiodinium natans]